MTSSKGLELLQQAAQQMEKSWERDHNEKLTKGLLDCHERFQILPDRIGQAHGKDRSKMHAGIGVEMANGHLLIREYKDWKMQKKESSLTGRYGERLEENNLKVVSSLQEFLQASKEHPPLDGYELREARAVDPAAEHWIRFMKEKSKSWKAANLAMRFGPLMLAASLGTIHPMSTSWLIWVVFIATAGVLGSTIGLITKPEEKKPEDLLQAALTDRFSDQRELTHRWLPMLSLIYTGTLAGAIKLSCIGIPIKDMPATCMISLGLIVLLPILGNFFQAEAAKAIAAKAAQELLPDHASTTTTTKRQELEALRWASPKAEMLAAELSQIGTRSALKLEQRRDPYLGNLSSRTQMLLEEASALGAAGAEAQERLLEKSIEASKPLAEWMQSESQGSPDDLARRVKAHELFLDSLIEGNSRRNHG